MEKDIDYGHTLDIALFALDRLQHRFSRMREDHIADSGDPTGHGGSGTGFVGVTPLRCAWLHILPE